MNYLVIRSFVTLTLITFCFSAPLLSQTIPLNKFGARVVESVEFYKETVEKNSDKQLIDLEKFIPGILLDIKYASPDNFTKQTLYSKPKAFARLPVAESLKKIQTELAKKGLGLKIFDTYRPYRTQSLCGISYRILCMLLHRNQVQDIIGAVRLI